MVFRTWCVCVCTQNRSTKILLKIKNAIFWESSTSRRRRPRAITVNAFFSRYFLFCFLVDGCFVFGSVCVCVCEANRCRLKWLNFAHKSLGCCCRCRRRFSRSHSFAQNEFTLCCVCLCVRCACAWRSMKFNIMLHIFTTRKLLCARGSAHGISGGVGSRTTHHTTTTSTQTV